MENPGDHILDLRKQATKTLCQASLKWLTITGSHSTRHLSFFCCRSPPPVSLSKPLQVRKLPNTPRKPFRELTRFAVTQPPGYEAIRGRIGIEPLMAAVDPVLQKISELEDQQRHFAEGTPEFAARQWAIDELKHDIAPFQYQQGLDLLEQMLLYPPAERLSAEQALEHRFFAEYHDPAEEPSVRPDVPFDASFEMFDLGAVCGPHPIVRGSNPVM